MLSQSPNFSRAGIVLLDPETGEPVSAVPLLYNPPSLKRDFQLNSPGERSGRAEPLRLNGPPVESITIEAKVDAADGFQRGDTTTQEYGIAHYLAALQSLVTPSRDQLLENNARAQEGQLTIIPMEQPLPLFVWGPQRIVPFRVGSLGLTEDLFDAQLRPLQATVRMSLRVLTVDDLGFDHVGSSIYLLHLQGLEEQAAAASDSASQHLFSML